VTEPSAPLPEPALLPEPAAPYNPIFQTLVGGSRDLEGLVAYGLYKIAKREYVEGYRRRHGKPPTPDVLDEYVNGWTESRIAGVQGQAKQALASFGEAVLEDAVEDIRREAIEGKIESELAAFQQKLDAARRSEFRRAVGYGIAAAFVYTLILIGIALILRTVGIDLLGALQAFRPQ